MAGLIKLLLSEQHKSMIRLVKRALLTLEKLSKVFIRSSLGRGLTGRRVFLGLFLSLLAACNTSIPTSIMILTPTTSLLSTLPPPISTPRPTLTSTHSPSPTLPPTDQPPSTAQAACLETKGHVEISQLATGLLREPLDYRVYLPPCYEFDTNRHYPVLYLIHGQSYNDDQWERLGAGQVADVLITKDEIVPFLIVMPRDRVWSQPDQDMFGEAVIQSLVPWIDTHYRTLADRKYRAVGGLSRGAGWAVHLALSHWELFGTLGAHSLPIFWSDTDYIKKWLDEIPFDKLPRIYMDIGDDDRTEVMKSAVWFENLLTERDIPHEWHLFAGPHEEIYWQTHLEQYLRWYTAGW